MRSFTGGEARHRDDGSPNFPGRDFPGRDPERLTLNMGRKFRPIYIFYTRPRTHPPPSLFVRPACSPLLSLVLSMEGTSCARLMPAGHDCAAITRSSGMTKMSKRKIMVRKWSGEGRDGQDESIVEIDGHMVKNPWEVDDESQLRSRKRNCCNCYSGYVILCYYFSRRI